MNTSLLNAPLPKLFNAVSQSIWNDQKSADPTQPNLQPQILTKFDELVDQEVGLSFSNEDVAKSISRAFPKTLAAELVGKDSNELKSPNDLLTLVDSAKKHLQMYLTAAIKMSGKTSDVLNKLAA